jgi:16S rRNA (adenine1518-N6/adenine1519-N6)-dimethyltransferase
MALLAKKSLGQHFLRSDKALREMVEAGKVGQGDTVLEIGPGEGVLTEALLTTGARVVVVELDDRAVPVLQARFEKEAREGKFVLIHGDVRDPELLNRLFGEVIVGSYKLIANIPYYITGMLFRMFLEVTPPVRQPSCMVYLIQKEVADNLAARDGKMNTLALAARLYGNPRKVSVVPRGAFLPPPKVDSAIVVIDDISNERIEGFTQEQFFDLVHAGLGSRRKQLLSNIASAGLASRGELEEIFGKLDIDLKVRGEDLSFEKWCDLARAIN